MPLRIENAIDMHCHFGPDTIGGRLRAASDHSVTGYEAAQEARDSGHRAIVLKSHSFCSCQLATNIESALGGLHVFGGACTDHASGGLSVETVYAALKLGARIVWLPTVNSCEDMSRPHAANFGWTKPGIPVIDEDGEPTEAVREIFALVKEHDAVLATGHTTLAEHHAVCKAFAREGKVLVTHAGEALAGPKLDARQAKELADLGATIELTAECCVQVWDRPPKTPQQMIEMIDTIGHERCTLSSDYGWTKIVPKPAQGLKDFLEKLWANGMGEAKLERMVSANPARLLALE